MTANDVPEVVEVKVASHEGRELKVTWRVPPYPDLAPYHIPSKRVEAPAKRIRDCLDILANKYVANNGAGHYGPELKALAKAGYDLCQCLFLPADASGQETASFVEKWLAQPGPRRVAFTVSEPFLIPWGLVFDRDPRNFPDESPDDPSGLYADFWCLKHFATTFYERIALPLSGDVIPRSALRVLPVVNRAVLKYTRASMTEDERDTLRTFLKAHKPVCKKDAMLDYWDGISEKYRLLYVVSHAEPTRLEISDDESITAQDIWLLKPKNAKGEQTVCLLFLNGCFTAASEEQDSFISATGRPGFFGLVGTEASIPGDFAVRFGQEFMTQFWDSGQSLLSVMDDLRRKHWPLSLLYSIYCSPSLRIDPPERALAGRRSGGSARQSLADVSHGADH